ncbi:MAG TPA: M20 family metallopeptidase, partial [Anaerolineae bacterium]|nr:M20 family metallopeptidase [Anaerolineae bacterium]
GHQHDMVALLTRLIELESPSGAKPEIDRLAGLLGAEAQSLGADVQLLEQETAGSHLLARWGTGPGGTLLLCHMDTVWQVGTLADRPIRVEQGLLYGPGALDMKGGIVNALWAMRALLHLGLPPRRRVTLLINSDEETGSTTSRSTIEALAREHDVALVIEPAQPPDGALKTERKGTGAYRVEVTGRAAHAGVDHCKGINAIEELAHQILTIQHFTDYVTGTTVNVGLAGGGTRSNVVPEHAWARVDVRVTDQVQAAHLDARFRALAPRMPGTALSVSGGIGRPPMVRTPAIAVLYQRAAALAREIGFEVPEAASGGGSDGNFTAALGLPTLDGLGVVGDGAHAAHEHVILDSLPQRAALLAALLHSLDQNPF